MSQTTMRARTQSCSSDRWRGKSQWISSSLTALPLLMIGCVGNQDLGGDVAPLSKEEGNQAVQKTPLVAEPNLVSMGKVAADQPRTASFKVKNLGDMDVRLDRVDSTCSCLRVLGIPLTIASGSTHELTVTYDPREEPDFRGGLSIGLIGRDQAGVEQFHSRVELRVIDPQGRERKQP